ncbi:MAG: flagellar biosynthesis anti-sigma factor FlgM [Candidatus Acidiferrales bacterium]
MRIDPNSQSSEAIQQQGTVQDSKNQAAQKAQQDPNASSGVQVQLSTSSNQVAALAQQAANVPAVRTDRVDALQQTVRDGNFNVSNEQVAAAIYSDAAASGTNEQG